MKPIEKRSVGGKQKVNQPHISQDKIRRTRKYTEHEESRELAKKAMSKSLDLGKSLDRQQTKKEKKTHCIIL
jgi:hypothetical protein